MSRKQTTALIIFILCIALLFVGVYQRQQNAEREADRGVAIGPLVISTVDTERDRQIERQGTWSVILLTFGVALVVVGGATLFFSKRR